MQSPKPRLTKLYIDSADDYDDLVTSCVSRVIFCEKLDGSVPLLSVLLSQFCPYFVVNVPPLTTTFSTVSTGGLRFC
ncbi:hypothetical protein E2C01_089551 [Portunus trituberculatus]|uniref:Uncharacterized protein n=1 Tax=Portunus trituberculatus TaxID=210409 RepID=A0A5B7JPW3_PORTR|nr:hypothetical protein [Portunus trituberculatus]